MMAGKSDAVAVQAGYGLRREANRGFPLLLKFRVQLKLERFQSMNGDVLGVKDLLMYYSQV